MLYMFLLAVNKFKVQPMPVSVCIECLLGIHSSVSCCIVADVTSTHSEARDGVHPVHEQEERIYPKRHRQHEETEQLPSTTGYYYYCYYTVPGLHCVLKKHP